MLEASDLWLDLRVWFIMAIANIHLLKHLMAMRDQVRCAMSVDLAASEDHVDNEQYVPVCNTGSKQFKRESEPASSACR